MFLNSDVVDSPEQARNFGRSWFLRRSLRNSPEMTSTLLILPSFALLQIFLPAICTLPVLEVHFHILCYKTSFKLF
jgi:hypothetical protein